MRFAGLLAALAGVLVAATAQAGTHAVVPIRPEALAVGPNGNVYFADDTRNQVLERLPSGAFEVFARGLKQPAGMVFLQDGTLVVADEGSNRVRAISPGGRVTTIAGNGHAGWIETEAKPLQAPVAQPADVKLAPNGDLVIAASSEVLRLHHGTLTRVAGIQRFQGVYGVGRPALRASVDGPDGLAFDAKGNLYLAGFNTKALLMVTPRGTLKLIDDSFYPRGRGGLVTAPHGAVVGMEAVSLVRVSPTGVRPIVDFLKRTVGDIEHFSPNGIAVGPSGDVYLDSFAGNGWDNRSALIVVKPSGRIRVLWEAPR